MKTLRDIKMNNEAIVTFGCTQDYYNGYQLLCDTDLVPNLDNADISGIIEYTLHRMLESGFSAEDINYNSNMYIPSDEEMQDLEEFEEFTHVDLGYILGGLITHIEFEEESKPVEKTTEEKAMETIKDFYINGIFNN